MKLPQGFYSISIEHITLFYFSTNLFFDISHSSYKMQIETFKIRTNQRLSFDGRGIYSQPGKTETPRREDWGNYYLFIITTKLFYSFLVRSRTKKTKQPHSFVEIYYKQRRWTWWSADNPIVKIWRKKINYEQLSQTKILIKNLFKILFKMKSCNFQSLALNLQMRLAMFL